MSAGMARAGFRHAFSTRIGGVSPVPFETLDFALGRPDPERLRENQARLARTVGFAPDALHQATQVHGRTLLVADGDPEAMRTLEADALVAEPGTDHAVAVRVADCVPVLLADPASGRVAAVHAGWRGVEAGIIEGAIEHMAGARDAGDKSAFVAAIGPCIGPCCFEVGADVGARIAKASTASVVARAYDDDDGNAKMLVDLRAAVRAQLERLGLSTRAVDDVPSTDSEAARCTRCDRDRFFSFRRDGDASGRLIGVIVASKRA